MGIIFVCGFIAGLFILMGIFEDRILNAAIICFAMLVVVFALAIINIRSIVSSKHDQKDLPVYEEIGEDEDFDDYFERTLSKKATK